MQIRLAGLIGGLLLLPCGNASAADLPVPAETVEIVARVVESRWSFVIVPFVISGMRFRKTLVAVQ